MNEVKELSSKVVATPICLSFAMIAKIDKQAQDEGLLRGRSAIVRRAVADYLARNAHSSEDVNTEISCEEAA